MNAPLWLLDCVQMHLPSILPDSSVTMTPQPFEQDDVVILHRSVMHAHPDAACNAPRPCHLMIARDPNGQCLLPLHLPGIISG